MIKKEKAFKDKLNKAYELEKNGKKELEKLQTSLDESKKKLSESQKLLKKVRINSRKKMMSTMHLKKR